MASVQLQHLLFGSWAGIFGSILIDTLKTLLTCLLIYVHKEVWQVHQLLRPILTVELRSWMRLQRRLRWCRSTAAVDTSMTIVVERLSSVNEVLARRCLFAPRRHSNAHRALCHGPPRLTDGQALAGDHHPATGSINQRTNDLVFGLTPVSYRR